MYNTVAISILHSDFYGTRRIFKATRHRIFISVSQETQDSKANISAARCIQIELLTDGAVTCEELNPNFDWDSVWKLFKKRYANEIETARAC